MKNSLYFLLIFLSIFFSGCVSSEVKGARTGDLSAVKEFVDKGGDVNERKKDGMTLLMYASAGGHVHLIDYLMQNGADLRLRDNGGYTAFLHGAAVDRTESMEALLGYGADLNDRDSQDRSALVIASFLDYYSTAVFLLDRDAGIGDTDKNGWTPLLASLDYSASLSSGFGRVFGLLKERGGSFSVNAKPVSAIAFKAARLGNNDVLALLFSRGLKGDIRDSGNNTLLHAGVAHVLTAEYLLSEGVDINGQNGKRESPLIGAVKGGYGESAALLLEHGADREIRDSSGMNALLYGAAGYDIEILRMLILQGADIFVTDPKGNTPLHLAAAEGTAEGVRLLLTAGIYVNSANGLGKTPYDMSFLNEAEGEAIRKILIIAGAVIPREKPAAGMEESAEPRTEEPPAASEADQEETEPPAAEAPVETGIDTETPAASVPAETPVPAQEETESLLNLSWGKIVPSAAEGWSNRDKLTLSGMIILSAPDGEELLRREITLETLGVNGKAGSVSLEEPENGQNGMILRMVLNTEMDRYLVSEIILDSEDRGSDILFDSFSYVSEFSGQ